MTGWEPATEAEVAMRDALHAQDQQQYFRVLTHVDLVLPVAGGSGAEWGTWTSGGRTHVLAFTSVAALRASLGENAGATRRLPFADLAAGWPDQEWWLAVNPGLPVEGYLPAWYVAQLARGDVRLPGRTMGARARLERVQSAARAARNGATGSAHDDPAVLVPAASPPPPPVPPERRGRVAEPEEPTTVPMRTGPVLGRRVPTVSPPRPEPTTGERGRTASGDGSDVDALDGWLTDLRRHPGEPDPFAAGRTAPAAETPPAPPPARSFFEPTSGRSTRRSSPLDTPRRPAERATPPSRFAGGQPFPRRRPLNEPVREDPTRVFGVGPDEPASPPHAAEPAAPFQPARPPEDATRTLPRRSAGPAVPAADEWAPTAPQRDAPGWRALAEPAEVEELPPSVAEPVSVPSAPLPRDFTPIVIEGVVIEARDLTDPAPAWSPPAADGYAAAPDPAAGATAPWAGSTDPLPHLAAPVEEKTSPLPPVAGPDDVTVRLGRRDAPSAEPTVSLFEPTSPLFEPTPDEPSPVASLAGEPRTSLFEPHPAAEPTFGTSSPAEPTVSLFTPASSEEPTTSLFGPGSPEEPTTSLFGPGSPEELTTAFAPSSPVEPTASPVTPTSSEEATASLFAPAPLEDATTALFAPAPPEEATTALFGPASSPNSTTALSGSGSEEEPTAFVPAAPVEPSASLFEPAAPTASSYAPTPEEATTALFTPGSPEESTAALYAPTPEESTTTLFTPVPAEESTTALFAPAAAEPAYRPTEAERTVAEPVAAGSPPPPAEPDFEPANEVEEELLAAAGSGNTDGFLTTLLLARVLLPVAFDSAAGSRPGDPGFSWRTETVDGVRYVAVFTSPERLAEHAEGPVDTIRVKFVQLIRRWPDENWSFLINPGSPVGASYPGEQVLALANWAAEVGLGDDPETEPEPAATGPAPAARPRSDAPAAQPSRPVTMQKAIAASQLSYYLERGYDRVSGFVHRAGELSHLRTPAELYDALGLGHPGSPFSRDDEELYLLRWPAYRPSLYRIPYGGQNEAAMRAMEGWVIERSPFRGNGFAPGESSDVIAEFKVDSARLPHGAELWRVGADGDARLVAVLDTDALLWRKADEA
ncbi:SseB protein N-terminal domain-containing protein [Micromonospora humi]|uniref:SseB protein N-terminal domain-containing protein n=1 Tax=Micromonospora humi TaxID=745366 RepID=A0A1C5IMM0_9ACTN|nr:SseB family protein [Micromonospora humi]SCG59393.1 SseB protein N-terminal domain-containing protein [Micromonospora humi]